MELVKAEFIKHLTASLGIVTKAVASATAAGVKVSRRSHYTWMENDEEYRQQVEELKDVCLDFVEDQLFELIREQETTAILFYLKTQGKKRGYIETTRTENEHSAKDGQIFEITFGDGGKRNE